jgi:hypothetical protein
MPSASTSADGLTEFTLVRMALGIASILTARAKRASITLGCTRASSPVATA